MFLRTLLLTVLISVACAAPGAAQFFSDDFDDGVISAAYWSSIGVNTESGGYLNLNRGTANQEDFIETVDTFDGNWGVEFDMRLNQIGLGDRFHGVSIVGANGQGITFGYSLSGQLFLGVHDDATGRGSTMA